MLDCANGAASATSPESAPADWAAEWCTLNGHVDGTFPGRRSEPTEANLSDLRRMVPALGADLGIAHDGDADRAIFVDEAGRFIPGEKILTLLGRDRVMRHHGGVVVTPVSGTQALEEVVRPLGGEVVYTRVGSPSVTHAMQERSAVFGGEENGGLIFPELQLARDGAMTAAAVLDYLARSSVTMAGALAGLPDYTMVKMKVDCPVERGSPARSSSPSSSGPSGSRSWRSTDSRRRCATGGSCSALPGPNHSSGCSRSPETPPAPRPSPRTGSGASRRPSPPCRRDPKRISAPRTAGPPPPRCLVEGPEPT